LVVDWKGDCFVCTCEAWLPITVGKITDFTRLEDVWTSPVAQILQQTITDRTYSECAVDRCGILDSNVEQPHYTVSINIDESCNLACPSCRKDPINITAGSEYDRKLSWVNHLVALLENFNLPCQVIMSGNGDPLASSIMRPLLHKYNPPDNHHIRLYTNGLLLEKQLANNLISRYIKEYFISVDAGSADVYEQVRLGGRWTTLLHNLEFLHQISQQDSAKVLLLFVLQRDNHNDMENFIQLCLKYGFNGWINRLENWGTYGVNRFPEYDVVGNVNHPLHATTLENLRSVYSKYNGQQIKFESSLVALAKETV
jgi:organic radical activating enzyme